MNKEKHQKKDKESTNKDDSLQQTLQQVLVEINKLEHIVYFQRPVDTKENPRYLTVITNPMDISKIKKNIKKQVYTTKKQFMDDINLIWKNCKLYNEDGSDFYVIATILEKKCQKIFNKYLLDKKQINSKKIKSSNSSFTHEQNQDQSVNTNKETLIVLKPDKVFSILNQEPKEVQKQTELHKQNKNKDKSARKQEKMRLKREKMERRLLQEIEEEQQVPAPLLSQNPMNEEQKQKILECISNSNEEILYKMIKVVDKYENYMVQQIPNKTGQLQFNISLKSLDQRTIQKMIEVAQGKIIEQEQENLEQEEDEKNKIKQEQYELEQLSVQQQMIIEKIQD